MSHPTDRNWCFRIPPRTLSAVSIESPLAPGSASGTAARRAGLTAEGTNPHAFEVRDWGELAFAGIVWGASFIFIAEGVDHLSPFVVTFGRMLFGLLTLALFPSARSVRIAREDWPRTIVVGITWLAFPMTLFPLAQQHISSGLAGMLNGSIPLFAAVVGSIALSRLPGRNQIVGLLVGALGVVLLGIPALGDGGSSALGVALIVIACASYGVAVTINVPLAQKYGAIPTFFRAQWVAVVLTAPLGLWGASTDSEWVASSMGAVVVLGIGGTALAFLAMVSLSTRVGSTRAASLTYVEAVIALFFGAIVRNESIRPLEVAGCAVLLAGAWLVSRADLRAR
jgi:drug/metabolite transporter (DMT)-like permease